jgi:signal transduction histidine kinase
MNMIMMMEAAKDLVLPEQGKLKEIIALTHRQAQKGLTETRRALKQLRPEQEEKSYGLPAIQELITVFAKVTGVTVKQEYGNFPFYFPEAVNIFLYKMIQEGLTNAFRHGNATEILVHFWIDAAEVLTIRIRDNGRGADEEIKEGIGLVGMRERLHAITGTLEARNVLGGFEIAAHIPLHNILPAEKNGGNFQ